LPSGSLETTIADYNTSAAQGLDALGKNPEWLKPFDQGPYAAFDLSFGSTSYRAFTLGGLRVSADGEVRREDGSTIPGLYAAGACASNLAQEGLNYASGLCLGTASYFGRRAGAKAARSA
jgi:predicted oxidoreductase